MAKLQLGTVANLLGNPTSAATTINNNSALTITALENTLSRDGTTPNQMNADIDLNGNDLLNVDTLDVENLVLDGQPVVTQVLPVLPPTVMTKPIYDPSNVGQDVYSRRYQDNSVVRFGASTTNTAAQNQSAFASAEAVFDEIYVPPGDFLLETPLSLGMEKAYYGEGRLVFLNADWQRPGGSAGGTAQERYTLFYDYTSQSDVVLLYNGVSQTYTWVDDTTILGPASISSDTITIRILNGFRLLTPVPEMIRSFNSLTTKAKDLAASQAAGNGPLLGFCNWAYGTVSPIALTTGINNTYGGVRAGRSNKTGSNNTFFGFQAGYRALGSANTAVGSIAGEWLTSGTNNSFFGALAGAKAQTGNFNTAVGYDAFGENETGSYNVAYGYRALANPREDLGPTGSPQETVAVGVFAGDFSFGNKNVWSGYRAGNGVVGGSDGFENVGIGYFSMRNHAGADYNVGIGVSSLLALTSGQSNTAVGHSALSSATTVGAQSAFGYQSLMSSTTGVENSAFGNGTLATNTTGSGNSAFGSAALFAANSSFNSAFGVRSLGAVSSGNNNTAFGYEAGRFITAAPDNSFFGFRAGRASTGSENTAYGSDALIFNTTGTQNTAVGRVAGRLDQSGANMTAFNNTTTVGYDARVSGSNQVQLGNASTTTYVYGTVQNRSDKRDKADIRDTQLGLDFINSLRPVDFKWDMRDDYVVDLPHAPEEPQLREKPTEPKYPELDKNSPNVFLAVLLKEQADNQYEKELTEYFDQLKLWEEDEQVWKESHKVWEEEYEIWEKARTEWYKNPQKDGSKKRHRYHHGFIAQELPESFGGLQDHSMADGKPVMSVGYDEMIAPLVKAVQELKAEVDSLKKKLHEAGS